MYCSTCIERRCIAAPHAPSSHQALCGSASRLAAGWVTCHPHTPHTPSSPAHQANSKTRTRTTPFLQYMHTGSFCSNRQGTVAAFNSARHDVPARRCLLLHEAQHMCPIPISAAPARHCYTVLCLRSTATPFQACWCPQPSQHRCWLHLLLCQLTQLWPREASKHHTF